MSKKSALFMARTTRLHDFVRTLASSLGVEVHIATPDSPAVAHDFDLLILDGDGVRSDRVDAMAKWLEQRGGVPMLLMMDEENLSDLHLPSHVRSDFICSGASDAELASARPPAFGRWRDRRGRRSPHRGTTSRSTLPPTRYRSTASRLTSRLWNTRCSAFWQRIPQPCVQPRSAAASRVGLRRLRRNAYGRCPYPSNPQQGGSADRRSHLHGSWCGLPVQGITCAPGRVPKGARPFSCALPFRAVGCVECRVPFERLNGT